jgi:hypothetical protein
MGRINPAIGMTNQTAKKVPVRLAPDLPQTCTRRNQFPYIKPLPRLHSKSCFRGEERRGEERRGEERRGEERRGEERRGEERRGEERRGQ